MIIVTREYSIKRHHIQYIPNTTIITHKALHHHQNLKKIYIALINDAVCNYYLYKLKSVKTQ